MKTTVLLKQGSGGFHGRVERCNTAKPSDPELSNVPARKIVNMSYSLKSLKGGYIDIGDYYRGY